MPRELYKKVFSLTVKPEVSFSAIPTPNAPFELIITFRRTREFVENIKYIPTAPPLNSLSSMRLPAEYIVCTA